MNACPDQMLTLHAFVDNELDAVNAIAFERHLETCDGCSTELASTSLFARAPNGTHRALHGTRGPAGASACDSGGLRYKHGRTNIYFSRAPHQTR